MSELFHKALRVGDCYSVSDSDNMASLRIPHLYPSPSVQSLSEVSPDPPVLFLLSQGTCRCRTVTATSMNEVSFLLRPLPLGKLVAVGTQPGWGRNPSYQLPGVSAFLSCPVKTIFSINKKRQSGHITANNYWLYFPI